MEYSTKISERMWNQSDKGDMGYFPEEPEERGGEK